MNINKKSWHYALYDFAYKYTASVSDVCRYTRGVTLGILKMFGLSIAPAIVIMGMVDWFMQVFFGLSIMLTILVPTLGTLGVVFGTLVLVIGMFAWIILIAGSVIGGVYLIDKKTTIKSTLKKIKIKEGSFLDVARTSIKDYHDKVCTTVTFKD